MAGRCGQTRVSWGPSATYPRPNPAMRSSMSGSRPKASSQAPQRPRRGLAWCTVWSISHPRRGVVVNVSS